MEHGGKRFFRDWTVPRKGKTDRSDPNADAATGNGRETGFPDPPVRIRVRTEGIGFLLRFQFLPRPYFHFSFNRASWTCLAVSFFPRRPFTSAAVISLWPLGSILSFPQLVRM